MKSKIFSVPGSCGELVQGIINGVNIHITCPIDRYSRASVKNLSKNHINDELITGKNENKNPVIKKTVIPGKNNNIAHNENNGTEKVRRGVSLYCETSELNAKLLQNILIDVNSELPSGKGMASSTADIGAVLAATASLFDMKADVDLISRIALRIEPTDGVLFEGIVAFDHLRGKYFEPLGAALPLEVIVLEPPGMLDTVEFNNEKKKHSPKIYGSEEILVEAYEMVKEGISVFNTEYIGKGATLSARLNQQLLPKPGLDDIIETVKRRGALGVNVAHSGTVIGILADQGFGGRIFDKIAHYIPRGWDAYLVRMTDGGICEEG
ncbi:MAG: kinase [Rubrobacteridae bacterium]|nr:kinase [Rubrobacteridae bacterium]